jgi:hypothetical protein
MANKVKHPVQRLQLALVSENSEGSIMKFQIGAQSYRGEHFGNGGTFYDSATGITLRSSSVPDNMVEYDEELYVRGDDSDEDEKIMECNIVQWSNIVGAVQGFNKQFMGTPEAVIDRTE